MSATKRKAKAPAAKRQSASKTKAGGAARSGAKGSAAGVAGTEEAEVGISFESALEELEKTVSRLEGGDMPLEEALELFESGVGLSRQCNETLDAAERRIEILVAERGEGAVATFDAAPSDDQLGDDADDFDEDDDFED